MHTKLLKLKANLKYIKKNAHSKLINTVIVHYIKITLQPIRLELYQENV